MRLRSGAARSRACPFKRCRSGKVYKHLRHGKHKVQVKAIDRAGNVSRPASKKFKV